MYLLGEPKDSKLSFYILILKNRLHHIPMVLRREEEMSHNDLEWNFNFIKQNLEDLGVHSKLLQVFEANILSRRSD